MTNESKTLFIPLSGKAAMSREGFFPDETAERIAADVSGELQNVDRSRKLAVYMAMRAMQYDEIAAAFLAQNRDCAVVHLGCGLDSRCLRVGHAGVRWYDLDFEEVIGLRRRWFDEDSEYRMLASSVTELSWLDEIAPCGLLLVLAEGLTMYLTAEDMTALMQALAARFPQVTFVFDAYSHTAARLSKYKNPINRVKAKIGFALDAPEELSCGMRFAAVREIILPRYIDRLRGIDRMRFRFMGRFGNKLYRIWQFESGKNE